MPNAASNQVAKLGAAPIWLSDARRTLVELAALPDNWDGEGSPAITEKVIGLAFRVLNEIESYELTKAHIGPVPGGGLGFEWRCGNRDLDLEILPDASIEFLKAERRPSGFDICQMEDGQIANDRLNEICALVNWLMGI